MTLLFRKFFLSLNVLLFVSLGSVSVKGQCNFSRGAEGELCSTATYICGSELDGYIGTLRVDNISEFIWPGSSQGVCRNGGQFDNTSWFSFTACSPNVHLRITFNNCVHPANFLPETGIQSGLYSYCDKNASVACEDLYGVTSGVLNLQYTNFVPGQLVYFVLDGYAQSVCEFRIDVISGIDVTPVNPPDASTLTDGYITGKNIIECQEKNQPFTYSLIEPERKVNFNTACAPPVNFNPADSICYAWNVLPYDGRFFANQDSTGKNVDIVFTEPGVYTIYAETQFNPYYIGSCANAASGEINSWTVTVLPEVYITDPIDYFCAGETRTFCGQTITDNVTIVCNDDPCRIFTKEFRVITTQDNNMGTQYICAGSSYTFQGVNYTQPGFYEVIDNSDCAVKHIFTLDVVSLDAEIIAVLTTLDCNNPVTTLRGVGRINTGLDLQYKWTNASGIEISNQLDLLVNKSGEYTFEITYITPKGMCTDVEKIIIGEDFRKPDNINVTVPIIRCLKNGEIPPAMQLISANPQYIYRWTRPDGQLVNGTRVMVDTFNTNLNRPYLLSVTGANGCISDTSFVVPVNFQKAKIIMSGDDLTCYKPLQTLNVSVDIAIDSIRWAKVGNDPEFYGSHLSKLTHDVTKPGDYLVEVMASSSKCWNNESIAIAENKVKPDLTLNNEIKWNCNTKSINLSPQVTERDQIAYSWSTLDGNIISDLNKKEVVVASPGMYEIVVFDEVNGCDRSGTIQIVEETNVPSNIDVEVSDVSCFGEQDGEIEIVSTSGGFGPYTYFFEGNILNNADILSLKPGNYNISVKDIYECEHVINVSISEPEQLFVETDPEIKLEYSEQKIVTFSSNYDDSNIKSVNWYNSLGELLSTDFDLDLTGEKNDIISLEIINENGCIARAKFKVEVDNELKFFIPNIFSPNGDGVNDLLEIFKNKIPTGPGQIAIYDRLGNKILNHQNVDFDGEFFSWDGTFKGQVVVPGVYVMLLEITDFLGKRHLFKKDITIIR